MFSCAQLIDRGLPFNITNTIGLPVSYITFKSSSCTPGKSKVVLSPPPSDSATSPSSPSNSGDMPIHIITASARSAAAIASANPLVGLAPQ